MLQHVHLLQVLQGAVCPSDAAILNIKQEVQLHLGQELQHQHQEQELQVLAGNLCLLQRQKQETLQRVQIHLRAQKVLHRAQVLLRVHIQEHKNREEALILHHKIELQQSQNIHSQGSRIALNLSMRFPAVNRIVAAAVVLQQKQKNLPNLQSHQKSRLH